MRAPASSLDGDTKAPIPGLPTSFKQWEKKGGVQGAVQCPPLFRVDGSRACRLGVGVGVRGGGAGVSVCRVFGIDATVTGF